MEIIEENSEKTVDKEATYFANSIVKPLEKSGRIITRNQKILETIPNKIILIKVIDQNFYEGRIRLQNTSDKYIVYKFYIGQHMIYTVSPSIYYIKPFDNITVNIKRFEKVSYEQLKTKEKMDLIAIASAEEITDINDAKNFIKKEDMYSPETQIIKLDIEYDNGNNLVNYQNMINERITIAKEYNQQINMNNVNTVDEVNYHIEEVKRQIEKYNTKIHDLMNLLKDLSTTNLVEPPRIYIDKEAIELQMKKRDNKIIPQTFPLFLVVFFCCVGLLLGKILNRFF